MITKHDCSLYHAKQILNLTLTGIVNESSDQLGILYEYDANATHPAELANLAYDVLKAVPVLSTYHNSPTGNAPRIADRLVKKSMGELLAGIDWWNLKDWIDTIKEMWARLMSWFESLIEAFLDLLSDLVAFVLDAVQKVAEALGNLVQAVAEAGLTLVKAVAAAAMEALENLLKAALLALAYTILAFTLLTYTASFPLVVALFALVGTAQGSGLEIGFLYLKLENSNSKMEYEIYLDWLYVDFVDMKLPFMITEIRQNNEIAVQEIEPILMGKGNLNSNLESDLKASSNFEQTNESHAIRTTETLKSNNPIFIDGEVFHENFLWGFGATFGLIGTILGGLSIVHANKEDKPKLYTILGLGIAAIILYTLNVRKWTQKERWKDLTERNKRVSFTIGILTALIFTGALLRSLFGGESVDPIKLVKDLQFWIIIILRIINTVIGYCNFFLGGYELYNLETALLAQVSIFTGIVSLGFIFIGNPELRKNYSTFGKFCLYGGLGLFAMILTYFSVLTISAFFNLLKFAF